MLNDTATPRRAILALLLTAAFATDKCAGRRQNSATGFWFPARTTMVTAWTFPKNPLEDTLARCLSPVRARPKRIQALHRHATESAAVRRK